MARTHCTHQLRRAAAAFTLLELVIVLVIVAIMTAIAVPRYAAASAGYSAEMAARKIANDLTWAQSRARLQSASQAVSFDTVACTYTLVGVPDPDRKTTDYKVDLSDRTYGARLSLSLGGKAAITFNGFGQPDCGGSVVVTKGTTTRTVSINADNGAITIGGTR